MGEGTKIAAFWFSIFLITVLIIAWIKREEVKKQIKLASSLKTIGSSVVGKIVETIGVIFITLFFTFVAIGFGAKLETASKIAAVLILIEVGAVWRPRKSNKDDGQKIIFRKDKKE
jgi:uncharacterized membrane protein YfcA